MTARRSRNSTGFMLAPLLYMLALAGIGAAVMFSGYSQILRSNAEMTAINAARSQLQSAGQTLSASSVLDSATSSIVQPPAAYSATTVAGGADASRLPTNYANAGNTGTPHDVGVIDVSSGVRQLDPWGKFYIYCRWENAVATPSSPSIMVISAGPDGTLDTKCGDTTAQGDDRIITSTVAETINRANVWQVSSSSQVKFGLDSNAVRVNQDGSLLAASLLVTEPAAGVATPIVLKDKSGATVFTVSNAGAVSAGSYSATSGTFTTISVSGVAGIGAANITGATTIGTTLGVTGATTLTGLLTANGGVGTTTLTTSGLATLNSLSAGASGLGTTAITGTFTVNPGYATTLGGTLAVAGNTQVTGTLGATGNFNIATNKFTVDASTGNTAIAGTLTAGATTLASNHVTGNETVDGTFTNGNVNITGGTISGVTITGGTVSGGSVSGNIAGHAALDLAIANNLSDVANAATARANIGANNASNLTTGTLSALLLPASGVVAGTYNQVTVDATGRVTLGANTTASQWTNSGSDISFTGGNVGIGTVAGSQRLSVNGDVIIQGAAGTTRNLFYGTDTSKRWSILTNATAESGSNAGSDLVISTFKDDGTALANVFSITRSNSAAAFAGSVTAPNFIGNLTGNVSGTISGAISLSDGTAAAPGLYFTSETNTGIYRPGAGALGITAAGTDVMRFLSGGDRQNGAVNYFSAYSSQANNALTLGASGADTNVTMSLTSKGAGAINLFSNGAAALTASNASSSAVNYLNVAGSTAGNAVGINALGSDTDIGLTLNPKGAGIITLGGSLANYLTVAGAATTVAPVIGAAGSDTDVGITLTPKGAGNTVISSGNLGIGTTTPGYKLDVRETKTDTAAGIKALGYNYLTVNPGSAGSSSFYNRYGYLNNIGAVAVSSLVGSYDHVDNASNGYTVTTAIGAQNEVYNSNGNGGVMATAKGSYNYAFAKKATITTAYGSDNAVQASTQGSIGTAVGVHSYIENDKPGGTGITTAYGVQVESQNVGATIGNWYGVYVGSINGTVTTNRYPLYIADTGTSYFAGGIQMAASNYLNFGATAGSSGYGIRDNGGTIEVKNSGGSWGVPGAGAASTNFGAGTVSAPGLYVTGDTDTGLYQATANTLSVTAGGGEVLRLIDGGDIVTGAAVNYMKITSGQTTVPVTLSAAGSDTDISIALTPKGAGVVKANGPVNIVAGTTTTSAPVISATQTWNASGVTFTGVKENITDTASAAASLLMDLQVGGASKFSVNKAGNIVNAGSIAATGAITGSNLSGTNTGDQTITLTGDVTGSGTGSFATAIGSGKVTNAMLAGSIALSKLSTTGTADATTVLRGDGAWSAISSLVTGFAAGTVSAPGWAVTTDTDTGLYEPSANTLSITSGGVEAARFATTASGVNYFNLAPSATGNAITMSAAGSDGSIDIAITPKGIGAVKIAAQNAAGTPLIVKGAASQSAMIFNVQDNAGNPLFYISGAGTLVATGNGYVTGDFAVNTNKFTVTASSGNAAIAGTLNVTGNVGVAASGYYNFGATLGSSGYGVRDNGGTIECKNSGGAWAACAGGSTFAAGTVSAPGWAVTGDVDTGLWEPTANTLSISAGGVEAARFNTVASGVNYLTFTPSTTGNAVTMGSAGSDTDVNINITPKGIGGVTISGSAGTQFTVRTTATTALSAAVNGGATGTTGTTYGGYFASASSSGTGVYGYASSSTGTNYGGSFKSLSSSGTSLYALAGNAATLGLVVQGAVSQTGNLAEFQNSNGTVLTKIDASGNHAVAASGYYNFGSTTGSSGYGVRDNGGTVECKNSGGAWAACVTAAATTFAAGTVSAPGWAVTGDADTGLWEPTANTLSTSAGGVEVLRLNTVASGVDYFTMTPSATGSHSLTLAAAGSDTDVDIAITPKGAGGITTSGSAATQLSSTTSSTSTAKAVYGYATGATGSTFGGYFQSGSSSGIGVYGYASSSTGGTNGGQFRSDSSSGTSLMSYAGNAATIGLAVKGAASQTGDLAEFQNSSGTALTVVNASGNIGIGVSPRVPLEVNQTGATGWNNVAIFSSNPNYAGALTVRTYSDGATPGNRKVALQAGEVLNASTIPSAVPRELTLQPDGGNVGIGTATVNHLLDVYGNIGVKTSGYINFSSTDGTSGYGIRDNGGTIECKNSGGAWAACVTAAATTFAAGTVSAPGWAVTGDTDTGLWEPTANTLSTSAGGVEVLRLNTVASGVDYFTMTPSATGAHSLTLAAAGSDTDVSIAITPKGSGSITSASPLAVSGSIATTAVSGTTSSSTGSAKGVFGYASSATGGTYGGAFQSDSTSGIGVLGSAVASTGVAIGGYFSSASSQGTAVVAKAGNATTIGLTVKGAISQSNDLLEFQDSNGNPLSVVNASGNVGIGTASPAAKLHVSGGYARIDNAQAISAPNAAGTFTDGTAGMRQMMYSDNNFYLDNYSGALIFRTGGYNDRLHIDSSGNVGIGTSTPYNVASTNLHLHGSATTSLKWSTTATGAASNQGAAISLWSDNNVYVDNRAGDTVFDTGASGTERLRLPAAGNVLLPASSYVNFGATAGTSGYGLKDNAGTIQVKNSGGSWSNIATSQWTTTGSDIYYTTGNVGIGTNSPSYPLTVIASAAGTGNILSKNISATGFSGIEMVDNTGSLQGVLGYDNANSKTVINSQTNSLRLQIGGTDYVTLNTSGYVGIGTISPYTKLQVGSKVSDDGGFSYDTNALMVVHQTPTSAATLNDPQTVLMLARQGTSGQAYGAAATLNLSRFENNSVNSRTRLDIALANASFDAKTNNVMTLLSSGNVGIGTQSPSQPLDVVTAGQAVGNATVQIWARASGTTNGPWMGYDSTATTAVLGTGGGSTNGLAFWTYNSGWGERMRLSASGNVGIGTNSPTNPLTVFGNSASVASAWATNTNASGISVMGYNGSTGAYGLLGAGSNAGIFMNGNVGIGTTGPVSKLDVWGSHSTAALNSSTGSLATFTSDTTVQLQFGAIIGGTYAAWIQSKVDGQNASYPLDLQPAGGNVGIGTTAPANKLDINGGMLMRGGSGGVTCPYGTAACMNYSGGGTQYGLQFVPATDNTYPLLFLNAGGGALVGSVYVTASSTAFNTTSDRRLKENIAPTQKGLTALMQIPVNEFNFISDKDKKRVQGFIAQELEKIYPEAVSTNGDNGTAALAKGKMPWAVDYGRLTPLLVKSIQDLKHLIDSVIEGVKKVAARVDEAFTRLAAHDDRLKKLEDENKAMRDALCKLDGSAAFCHSAIPRKTSLPQKGPRVHASLWRTVNRSIKWYAYSLNVPSYLTTYPSG